MEKEDLEEGYNLLAEHFSNETSDRLWLCELQQWFLKHLKGSLKEDKENE